MLRRKWDVNIYISVTIVLQRLMRTMWCQSKAQERPRNEPWFENVLWSADFKFETKLGKTISRISSFERNKKKKSWKNTWKPLKWCKESWSRLLLSPVVGRGQQTGWSLRQTPAQTGCSARARRAAGGPTQGWARLWWCLRTTLSTQQAGWALGELVHTELWGARQGGTVDAAQQHILVRIFCACESFSLNFNTPARWRK